MAVALLVGLSLAGARASPYAISAYDGGDTCEVVSWLQLPTTLRRYLDPDPPEIPFTAMVDESKRDASISLLRISGHEHAALMAPNSTQTERNVDLIQVVRELMGVKHVCRVDHVGDGTHGTVHIIQVPKHASGVCQTQAGENFKFAVKSISSNDFMNSDVEALKLMSGTSGVVLYFGTLHRGATKYIFMQAGNRTLEDLLRETARNKTPLKLRVSMLIQMLHALARLEKEGIQHHDLGPRNIVIEGEHLMVADFGSACWRREDSAKECRSAGRLGWISPEKAALKMLRSQRPVKSPEWFLPKSDAWAAGVMAYQLLLGVDSQKLGELYRAAIGSGKKFAFLASKPDLIHKLTTAFLASKPDLIDRFRLRVPEPWLPLLKGMLQPNADQRWTMKMASEVADRIAQGLGFQMPKEDEASAALQDFASACGRHFRTT